MELSEKDLFWLEVMREFEASGPKGAVEAWRDIILDDLEHFQIPAKDKWISRFGDTFSDIPEWLWDDTDTIWSKDQNEREDQEARIKERHERSEKRDEEVEKSNAQAKWLNLKKALKKKKTLANFRDVSLPDISA